jgi:putative transposase
MLMNSRDVMTLVFFQNLGKMLRVARDQVVGPSSIRTFHELVVVGILRGLARLPAGAPSFSRFVQEGGDFDFLSHSRFGKTNSVMVLASHPARLTSHYNRLMPWGLHHFNKPGACTSLPSVVIIRDPLLSDPQSCTIFEQTLERVRRWYGFFITGYVVMPEHVHLLISEPERGRLSIALQMLKQITAQRLRPPEGAPFWHPRYYDFNVWSEAKRVEKLRYIHRNPVKRGLVERPEDWLWSSFRHHATGADGPVEIESQWTARRRERLGMGLTIEVSESQNPRPLAQNARRAGHPQR